MYRKRARASAFILILMLMRASDTSLGLLARNDFRVARDLGVVERMLPSQVRAAIFTVGLPRPRCTEDTGSGC